MTWTFDESRGDPLPSYPLDPYGVERTTEIVNGLCGDRTVTYIGIPALDGNTWPLRWYSEPTATAPFVETGTLRAVLEDAGL